MAGGVCPKAPGLTLPLWVGPLVVFLHRRRRDAITHTSPLLAAAPVVAAAASGLARLQAVEANTAVAAALAESEASPLAIEVDAKWLLQPLGMVLAHEAATAVPWAKGQYDGRFQILGPLAGHREVSL